MQGVREGVTQNSWEKRFFAPENRSNPKRKGESSNHWFSVAIFVSFREGKCLNMFSMFHSSSFLHVLYFFGLGRFPTHFLSRCATYFYPYNIQPIYYGLIPSSGYVFAKAGGFQRSNTQKAERHFRWYLMMDNNDTSGQIITTFPAGWSPQMVV